MRRGIGFTLICLGLFLAVLGGAIRYWAYDRLVVVPVDLYSTLDLPGKATYLDMTTLKEKTGNVVARQTIRADVDASTDRVLVVDLSQVISTAEGQFIRASVERAAIDRRNGAAVNCCDESVDEKSARHEGFLFKLPFDAPRDDVTLWDGTSASAHPAVYSGTATIAGHLVYKYVSTVPGQQIRTQADSGSLVGEPRTFDAPVWNTSTKTLWVEPVTGTPLAVRIETRTTLRNSKGKDKVTVFAATLSTDPAKPDPATLALVEDSMRRIELVQRMPARGAGTGAVLAVLGVALLLWRRRPVAGAKSTAPISPAPVSPAPVSPAPAGSGRAPGPSGSDPARRSGPSRPDRSGPSRTDRSGLPRPDRSEPSRLDRPGPFQPDPARRPTQEPEPGWGAEPQRVRVEAGPRRPPSPRRMPNEAPTRAPDPRRTARPPDRMPDRVPPPDRMPEQMPPPDRIQERMPPPDRMPPPEARHEAGREAQREAPRRSAPPQRPVPPQRPLPPQHPPQGRTWDVADVGPGRPVSPAPIADRPLSRYIRPYLDGDTGSHRIPGQGIGERTGSHRAPDFDGDTGTHRPIDPLDPEYDWLAVAEPDPTPEPPPAPRRPKRPKRYPDGW